MKASLRQEKLKEIQENNEPYASKDLNYQSESKTWEVYKIPLDALIFNQYNGRIATFVKTYEKEKHPIDAETSEGEKTLDKFLWDSRPDRNKITQRDLEKKGQQEYGIVTSDGVVIDGNRRFMLLRRIATEKQLNFSTEYFKAIILPHTLENNKKVIMRLETNYQMGVDDKVDYSPIQKYLKCRDLTQEGFADAEIAEMMGESEADIKTWLKILTLMDEYLEYYKYEGIYRVLEIEKLEGHFVDLNQYLSRYETGGIPNIDWSPKEPDIDDLKKIYFDYMRAGFNVHDIRPIGTPSGNNRGFFTKEKLWKNFCDQHFNNVEKVKNEEVTLDDWRKKDLGEDVVEIICSRDNDFKNKTDSALKNNFYQNKRELDDQKEQDKPIILLQRALKTLENVNTGVDAFQDEEVKNLSHKIRKKAEEFIKLVNRKR